MTDKKIEHHPLKPFLPSNTKLLMLGSFPPQQLRWSMDFYYPNLQNDMWRIFGLIFFGDKDHFLLSGKKAFNENDIRAFLEEKGIGVSDTARSVIRQKDNASDKFLDIITTIELSGTLELIPDCRAIVTTGQKATDTLLSMIEANEPKVGGYSDFTLKNREMRLYRMPSSSRAYPKPLTEKAEVYKNMFSELNLL